MITKENLIESANQLYENIKIKFVDGDNPYWDIQSPDPDEIDENITIAKLYYHTFELEIKLNTLLNDGIVDFVMIFGEDEEVIRQSDPDEFLSCIIDEIHEEIVDCINYNETLLDYLK